ncbi:CocE/NonD family hydrolase [Nocardia goodfellowii]|uniref:Acyl esterase n=1 Tax=Nocardia goodfellowii TaxID=882446 RepID=A0ABS4QFT3_9NOCA|nr:CocE/NonD family hydrolase [Nocardia goodfellowii]MBP2190548.1 putative acyl esterase [Nocardia goodfellowii]
MSPARSNQVRLLAPDQEALVEAVANGLLTGTATGVPDYVAEDVAAVRAHSVLGKALIPGDGVLLDGIAAWPRTGGPHPLIVLPAGLDPAGWKMYSGAIIRLLMRGYAVVAYTERGLPGSEGKLTVAGEEDVRDGSCVIDWALEHEQLNADSQRIGMAGISYGSGISQLVAHADERVKAVVALSTWADLGEALYDNGTRHTAAAEALAAISDRPSVGLEKVLEEFRANNIEPVLEYASHRSPALLPELRPVPTFFTSFWHETIFPQNQLLEFFERYPGPKRLDLAIGDHGAVEVPGLLLGVHTRTTEAAYDWFDRYLLGVDNGIDRDGVVHTETMHSFGNAAAADLSSWSRAVRRFYLTAPTGQSSDGTLTSEAPSEFSQQFDAAGAQVQAVTALVMDGFRERLLMPVRQQLPEVDRTAAAVWNTARFARPQHIAGTPEIGLTVTPSGREVTVIAYLFDLNAFTGAMRIITHAAGTVHNQEAGQPAEVRMRLQATDYHIPIGHKLVLVVDARDLLYFYPDQPDTGGTVTLSDKHGPAYVDVPMDA